MPEAKSSSSKKSSSDIPGHKNIVICFDGTGNQIKKNISNVLKLYRVLDKSDKQVVFYDQGVGTLGRRYTWGKKYQEFKNILGLGFGLGLDENVLQAYDFIVENYREHRVTSRFKKGDNIYIFGFSRGAHTARVLAAMLYEVGILRPEEKHLSGAALSAYKQSRLNASATDDEDDDEGENFRRITGSYEAQITFLGVWDTVSSVFVPNEEGFWPPVVREKLPHTRNNPAVRRFRHAIAVDEKRRMFRVDHWEDGQEFKPNKHKTGRIPKQDAVEMWFPGYHSDVGGGHERLDSGLSQYPFIWMIEQAKKRGLCLKSQRMIDYISGEKPWTSTTDHIYPKKEPTAKAHDSMKGFWKIIEWLPKPGKFKEWPNRKPASGFYFPKSEPRPVPDEAKIHPSVVERMRADKNYRPANLDCEKLLSENDDTAN